MRRISFYVRLLIQWQDNVRLLKVKRDGAIHTVTETTVCALIEGDIESSFTEADNSVVVATDTIKNTIFSKGCQIDLAIFMRTN